MVSRQLRAHVMGIPSAKTRAASKRLIARSIFVCSSGSICMSCVFLRTSCLSSSRYGSSAPKNEDLPRHAPIDSRKRLLLDLGLIHLRAQSEVRVRTGNTRRQCPVSCSCVKGILRKGISQAWIDSCRAVYQPAERCKILTMIGLDAIIILFCVSGCVWRVACLETLTLNHYSHLSLHCSTSFTPRRSHHGQRYHARQK
jgi:hypothetical protein